MKAEDVTLDDLYRAAEAIGMPREEIGDVVFEQVPPETIYRIAAYGFPRNYAHWSFGRDYWIEKNAHDEGRGKIFELVLADDPAVAYISDDNTPAETLLVMAHVLGHVWLFRQNRTCRELMGPGMLQKAANARKRFLEYEDQYGFGTVERIIDIAHALKFHSEPQKPYSEILKSHSEIRLQEENGPNADLLSERERRVRSVERLIKESMSQTKRYSGVGETDLILWLTTYIQLPDYVQDILSTVREQHLYHRGVFLTKTLHEGFATLTQLRIAQELGLDSADTISFAVTTSQVASPRLLTLNPYYLGYRALDYLLGKNGSSWLLDMLREETDLSFIRNHFDEELMSAIGLFEWASEDRHLFYEASRKGSTDWKKVKQELVRMFERVLHFVPRTRVVRFTSQTKSPMSSDHRLITAATEIAIASGIENSDIAAIKKMSRAYGAVYTDSHKYSWDSGSKWVPVPAHVSDTYFIDHVGPSAVFQVDVGTTDESYQFEQTTQEVVRALTYLLGIAVGVELVRDDGRDFPVLDDLYISVV